MKLIPKSEATRQFVIQSTAELFNIKGHSGTYIGDLEKATRSCRGSIYGNLENKDTVALVLFDRNQGLKRRSLAEAGQELLHKDKLYAHVLAHHLYEKKPLRWADALRNVPLWNQMTHLVC